MTTAEQLAALLREIGQELAELEAESEPLRAALDDAERKVEHAKAAQAALESACARGLGPFNDGLAGSLWGRLRDARLDMQREITKIRGALPARIKALDHMLADRRLALAQIRRALDAEPSRHVAEVIRRPGSAEVYPFSITMPPDRA